MKFQEIEKNKINGLNDSNQDLNVMLVIELAY